MKIRSKIYMGMAILWAIPLFTCFFLLDLVTLDITLKYTLKILLIICSLGWLGAVLIGIIDCFLNQSSADEESEGASSTKDASSLPSDVSHNGWNRREGEPYYDIYSDNRDYSYYKYGSRRDNSMK